MNQKCQHRPPGEVLGLGLLGFWEKSMKRNAVAYCVAIVLVVGSSSVEGVESEFANFGVENIIGGDIASGQILWRGNFAGNPWDWLPSELTSESAPLPGWDQYAVLDTEMQITSPITVDENLIGRASFIATTTLTAHANDQPSGTLVLSEVAEAGLIDFDASRANVDTDAGVIRLASGSPLDNDRPITEVTLLEATGVFAGIQQVGTWDGYYSGYYAMPLDPNVDLQQNILEGTFVGGYFETGLVGRFNQVPEPASQTLCAAGLVAIWGLTKTRKTVR